MDWKAEALVKVKEIEVAIHAASDPEDVMMAVDDLATYISDSATGTGSDEEEG